MAKNQKKYAVIKIFDRQYLVEEKQEISIDKLKDPKKIDLQVLLFVDGDNVKIGKPTLKDVKVKVKVVSEEEKGEKLRVFKYKAKSRYRKTIGFRPKYTKLLIEKIS